MKKIKQETFSIGVFTQKLLQNRKVVTTYVGGFVLVALILGSLALMHAISSPLFKIIQLLAFLGLGWVNASAIQGASFLTKDYFQEYLISTLLVAVIICLCLQVVYYFTNTNILMAYASTCAFLLPFTLLQSWFFYKHIPRGEQLTWHNVETTPDPLALSFQSSVSIRFQVARKYFDMQEIIYPVTVSSWVKLGALFHQFILEQNKDDVSRIELKDKDQCEYGWEFYIESIGGFLSRQLDPELNIRENKIVLSQVIIARRVKLNPEVVRQVDSEISA